MPPKKKRAKKGSSSSSVLTVTKDLSDADRKRIRKVLESFDGVDEELDAILEAATKELDLTFLSESDIQPLLDGSTRKLENLLHIGVQRRIQADRAFALLDRENRGVLVLEDLKASGVLQEEDGRSDEDLEEMLLEFCDGVLTRESFRRIAHEVKL